MAKTSITRNEYLQLEGLVALARRHYKVVNQCEAAINELLGAEEDDLGVGDVVYGDREIKWLLERQNLKVPK